MNKLWIVFLLVAFRAGALTLEECVDSALAHNPAVAAAALEVERARVLKATAFDPPMTEVTLKQETTGGGGPENGVYFGQEFSFPTLYVARHRELTARTDLAGSRFDLLLSEVRREVAELYCSLQYSREVLRLNAELGEIYDEFCRVAAVRLEEGESGRLELMNAERVRESNEMERREEMVKYRNLQLELQKVMGSSQLPEPDDQPFRPLEWEVADYEFGLTPRGRVAAGEAAVAARELTVAKNELLPGLRLGATVQALIKSFNPYHIERLPFEKGNFMGFEVGVTVPLFFGAPSARVRAAEVGRRISLLDMETAENETAARVAAARAEVKAVSERLQYYKERGVPQADEIRRIATVSYELGDIGYMEYISNLETAYAVYRAYADAVNNYNRAVVGVSDIFSKQ